VLNKLSITLAGEELWLLPEKALYWPAKRTLLVADVHLGKEHAFARRGVAIPLGPSTKTLQRLALALRTTEAQHCIVLGDFFHDAPTVSDSWLPQLAAFVDQHAHISFTIVAGNHDHPLGQTLVDERIIWQQNLLISAPFVLQHAPGSDTRGHVLAGHIHPVITVSKRHRRSIYGPCFWQQEHCTVLPAFGEFTGGHRVQPKPQDNIFLTGPDCVVAIPTKAVKAYNLRAHT